MTLQQPITASQRLHHQCISAPLMSCCAPCQETAIMIMNNYPGRSSVVCCRKGTIRIAFEPPNWGFFPAGIHLLLFLLYRMQQTPEVIHCIMSPFQSSSYPDRFLSISPFVSRGAQRPHTRYYDGCIPLVTYMWLQEICCPRCIMQTRNLHTNEVLSQLPEPSCHRALHKNVLDCPSGALRIS